MKNSRKFILTFGIAVLVLSFFSAVLTCTYTEKIKEEERDTFIQLIGSIREKYDIDDTEIIGILNGKSDFTDTSELLKRYGIRSDSWTVYGNQQNESRLILVSFGFYLTGGFVLLAIFGVYLIRQKKSIIRLTAYLSQVNRGNYELKLKDNTEDELSILRNEIYKTTVTLKEQCEISKKDKIRLKDSISDISHQIKTPLTSIMIMLDNLIYDEDMKREIQREFLGDIKNAMNSIRFLVQSLLTLSRLDVNAIEFKNEKQKISDILKRCVRNTEILAEIREVNVTLECDDDITLFCDKKWTVEAVSNIVKNCIEHTNQGGEVRLSAEENPLYTKITVSDTGEGISENDIKHIFDRFYKTKNAKPDSIGIGLSMSKAIVESQNGYISVRSTVGVGSQFVIKFFRNGQKK